MTGFSGIHHSWPDVNGVGLPHVPTGGVSLGRVANKLTVSAVHFTCCFLGWGCYYMERVRNHMSVPEGLSHSNVTKYYSFVSSVDTLAIPNRGDTSQHCCWTLLTCGQCRCACHHHWRGCYWAWTEWCHWRTLALSGCCTALSCHAQCNCRWLSWLLRV